MSKENLEKTPKAPVDKYDSIKLKTSCTAKETRENRQVTQLQCMLYTWRGFENEDT